MKSLSAALIGAGAMVALAGCAETNLGMGAFTADRDIAAAKGKTAQNAFNNALREDYLSFAVYERDVEYDWRDAGFHAAKAKQAAGDSTPDLSPLQHWQLPAGAVPRFNQGLADLRKAFADGGREKAPALASRAQTFFECWAEEQEENWQTERIAYCWSGFETSLAGLQDALKPAPAPAAATAPAPAPATAAVEPPARDYLVFFDFDKTDIRNDSAGILDRVVDAFGKLKGKVVSLIGHADRAGSQAYNQKLSERRAVSVRAYLEQRGIQTRAIETSGRGETDPRVPTPDGVREQENRRVEIRLD
jgi:OOP family OmpA-OmpF porin